MNHPNPLDSAKRKTARKSIITPQRKHHKMLKDGTSEVWPEDVEKIFIQGTSLPLSPSIPPRSPYSPQVSASTGNLPGQPFLVAVHGGATSSSLIISKRPV